MIIVPKHKKYTKNPNLNIGLKKVSTYVIIVQIFIFIVFFSYLSAGVAIQFFFECNPYTICPINGANYR